MGSIPPKDTPATAPDSQACSPGAAEPESFKAPEEHPATGRFHEHLLSCYRAGTDAFAKTLVTLAGGGLAVSVTFLEKLAGPSKEYIAVLLVGWVCLVAAVGGVLTSIHFSNEAMLEAFKSYPWLRERDELGGRSAAAVKYLNWGSLLATLVGLFLIAVFAMLNLKGR